MKIIRKVSIILVVALVAVGFVLPTFAASTEYKTRIAIVAGITGRTEESVSEEIRTSGKSCMVIAHEADKLEEYKTEEVKMVTAHVDDDVENSRLTRAEADDIIAKLKEDQENYADYVAGDYTARARNYGYESDYSYGYGNGYGCHGSYGGHHNNYRNDNNSTGNSSYGRGRGHGYCHRY